MKFKICGDAVNTSYKGFINCYYEELVKAFGKPSKGSDKSTCEWVITFEDGTICTIYDWKTVSTPMLMYGWHIGGRTIRSVSLVLEALEESKLL